MIDLNFKDFKKAWKRLKKNTSSFKRLIVRDTLDFLDFNVDLSANIEKLINNLKNSNYNPEKPYLHPSPKSKGISRTTVIFDVIDSLIYRFCIEQIEDDLIEKVKDVGISSDFAVYGGNRIKPNLEAQEEDFYERWFKDYQNMQHLIEKSLVEKDYLVRTDIASYFENIKLLTLKDLVRSEVEGKTEILNLLFYFLENVTIRYDYEVNTYTGLPQEDIDCSRILAYFFLNRLDVDLKKFCIKNGAKYYRWVDDISIAVTTKIEGKKALRLISESLRKLGLTASIEKTEIVDKDRAKEILLFKENKEIDSFLEKIEFNLINGIGLKDLKKEIEDYYSTLSDKLKNKDKSWGKLLKRFYTLFSILKSGILLPELKNHLIDYTEIVSSNKVYKYLVMNQKETHFNEAVSSIIKYLYSDENLYPQLESNMIEALLYLDSNKIDTRNLKNLKEISEDIFFKKNKYKPLSEYSRAVSLLLCYMFNREIINDLATHYIKYDEYDYILKKYLIFIALTSNNLYLTSQVLEKAKKEQNFSINRLINFIGNINYYKKSNAVKGYLKESKYIYIHKNNINGEWVKESYNPIRVKILKVLINKYSKV